MRFEPPTIKERGQLARTMAAVFAHKPAHGEVKGKVECARCGGPLQFVIDSKGISRGSCTCGIRWLT